MCKLPIDLSGMVAALATMFAIAANGEQSPTAPAVPAPACDQPVASVIVIDNLIDQRPHLADQQQRFQLPTPAQAMRSALQSSSCFVVLDSDVVFWTIPDTAQPDYILRASVAALTVRERNLGKKAGAAVGRYLSSYLGHQDVDVPQLRSLTGGVEVLCPKTRIRGARFSTTRNFPDGEGDGEPDHNGAMMSGVFADLAAELTRAATDGARFCAVQQATPRTP